MLPTQQKKAVTYGRRGKTSELTPTFTALNQKTPKKTVSPSSKLPSPSASPLRSPFPVPRSEKVAPKADIFDVPSSDEESRPKLSLSKLSSRQGSNRSTPGPTKGRKNEAHTSAKSTGTSQSSKRSSKAADISAHNELFSLSLPVAHDSGLLLPDRPSKRRKRSNSSRSSSHASTSAQSNIVLNPRTSKDHSPTAPDDIWEVPPSDGESAPKRPNPMQKAHTLQIRSVAKPLQQKSSKASSTAIPEPERHYTAANTTKISKNTIRPETPTESSTRPLSPSSTDSNDESPTPRNKRRPDSPQKGSSTPKQAKLWGQLLQDHTNIGTPSKSLKSLSLEQKDISDPAPIRRKGLVDALMSSASGIALEDDYISENSSVSGSDNEEEVLPKSTQDGEMDLGDAVSKAQLEIPDLLESEPQPELDDRTIPNNGPKRTYGGQRSYLEDSGDGLQGLLDEPLEVDDGLAMQGLGLNLASSLLPPAERKQAVPLADDLEDDTRGVKTVYDLRAAGDMEHFTDEVNEIVDDLTADKSSLSRKRMALLDLHKKLLQPAFRLRFNQHGYGPVIFRRCSNEFDTVVGGLGAAVLVQALNPSDGSSVDAFQLKDVGCLPFLTRQLSNSRSLASIAGDRRNNISKVAQSSIVSFADELSQTSPWKDKSVVNISPASLAMVGLEFLIRKLREQGSTEPLLDETMLLSLLDILDSKSPKKAGQGQDTEKPGELDELDTILSLLESCTTVAACTMDESTWTQARLERLAGHLELAMLVEEPSIRRLTPRLALNLANGNDAHASIFAGGSFVTHVISRIRTEFEALRKAKGENFDLDVLLLSLGAMLNLAEHSEKIRASVTADGTEQLDALIAIFLQGRKQAEEADSLGAVQKNVAYGWLAVLLGNLCRSRNIQQRVVRQLPGKGLKPIIDAVDEFVSHHRAADQTAQGNESYAMFTQRLEGVANLLRALDK